MLLHKVPIEPLEEQYRLLVEEMPDYAMLLLNSVGQIVSWNPGACLLFGYEKREVLGHDISLIFTHEDRAMGAHKHELKSSRTKGGAKDVRWHLKKDGSRFWADGLMMALRDEQGNLCGYGKVLRDATDRKEAEEALKIAAERANNIAVQLQKVLQPELPSSVPGLELANYYSAALEEASVGGDFCDVFLVNSRCTALVVGDLSGKGLAAATQVSIVKNMLRALIYRGNSLAEAVTDLNAMIVQNELLAGFATLIVACFDSQSQTLSYVNCGQEPGLILRKDTGRVEEMNFTGPILGAIENGVYEEQTITLSPGDAFALFTDGVTEVGPHRSDLFGIAGVTQLLENEAVEIMDQDNNRSAVSLAARLISGVDAYAQGGVRDDICLLVGVVCPE